MNKQFLSKKLKTYLDGDTIQLKSSELLSFSQYINEHLGPFYFKDLYRDSGQLFYILYHLRSHRIWKIVVDIDTPKVSSLGGIWKIALVAQRRIYQESLEDTPVEFSNSVDSSIPYQVEEHDYNSFENYVGLNKKNSFYIKKDNTLGREAQVIIKKEENEDLRTGRVISEFNYLDIIKKIKEIFSDSRFSLEKSYEYLLISSMELQDFYEVSEKTKAARMLILESERIANSTEYFVSLCKDDLSHYTKELQSVKSSWLNQLDEITLESKENFFNFKESYSELDRLIEFILSSNLIDDCIKLMTKIVNHLGSETRDKVFDRRSVFESNLTGPISKCVGLKVDLRLSDEQLIYSQMSSKGSSLFLEGDLSSLLKVVLSEIKNSKELMRKTCLDYSLFSYKSKEIDKNLYSTSAYTSKYYESSFGAVGLHLKKIDDGKMKVILSGGELSELHYISNSKSVKSIKIFPLITNETFL